MRRLSSIYPFLIFLLISTSFSCNPNKKPPDVSEIDIDLKVKRFEIDFFACQDSQDFLKLKIKYPTFYDIYMDVFMSSVTGGERASFLEKIENIKSAKGEVEQLLIERVLSTYADFESQKNEISAAMHFFKFYFPNLDIPQIITFIGKFDYGNPYYDSTICIGLEMYLNPDFSLYKKLPFPKYRIRKFKKDLLVPNTLKAHIHNVFSVEDWKGNRLLDKMIQQGKILCLMDAILPQTHDSLKIAYLKGQIEWCQKNESQMWRWLVENDLLYSTNNAENLKYLEDGPYTIPTGLVESAPRMAVWIGWQIVRKYMQKTQCDVNDLIYENDVDKILKLSRYKP